MDARIIHEHPGPLLKSWCPSSASSMTIGATSDYRSGRTFQSGLEQAARGNNPIRLIWRSPNNCKHRRLRCNSRQLNETFTATVGVNASMAAANEFGGDVAAAVSLDLPSLMTPPAGSAVHEGRTVVDTSNGNGSCKRQQHNPYKAPSDVEQRNEGLGIVDFLKGKHIFITGATGFLAKVLVEKILREQPEVGQLYLLIQPRNNKSPQQRLQDEVLNCRLFEVLRKKHGDSYPEFVRTKVSAVLGNVTSKGLGIDPKIAEDVASEVDVIVHSAASTNFHEQYQTALTVNTLGPSNVLAFGKCCPRLQVFVHYSTAYVNGTRQGLTTETPFRVGDSIAKEKLGDSAPTLDARKEIEDAYNMLENRRHEESKTLAQIMTDMGLARAKAFGWQDTYVFTKAMGEMLLDQQRGNIPVAIIRPSAVESTYSQPFPGWIEGNRMVDPLITLYGKRQLTGFVCDPEAVVDLVPCDMVINATLAAMVKHSRQPGLAVYHVSSSHQNSLFFKTFFTIVYHYLVEHPLLNVEAVMKGELRPFSFLPNVTLFKLFLHLTFLLPLQVKFVMDNWVEASRSLASPEKRAKYSKGLGRIKKASEQYEQMAVMYQPYTSYRTRFGSTNSFNLHNELSPEEQDDFGFDMKQIDWQHYLCNIHVPGFRQYVMKGRFGR